MTVQLCPFCGDNTAETNRSPSGYWYVECQCCKARGPFSFDGELDAVKAWNERDQKMAGVSEKDSSG